MNPSELLKKSLEKANEDIKEYYKSITKNKRLSSVPQGIRDYVDFSDLPIQVHNMSGDGVLVESSIPNTMINRIKERCWQDEGGLVPIRDMPNITKSGENFVVFLIQKNPILPLYLYVTKLTEGGNFISDDYCRLSFYSLDIFSKVTVLSLIEDSIEDGTAVIVETGRRVSDFVITFEDTITF